MKTIISIFICIVMFIGFVWLLNIGLIKQEQFECYQWARQAENNPNFYYLQWQKDQCGVK